MSQQEPTQSTKAEVPGRSTGSASTGSFAARKCSLVKDDLIKRMPTALVSSSGGWTVLLPDGTSLRLVQATEDHRSYILSTWVKSYVPVLRKWLGPQFPLKEEADLAERLWKNSVVCTSGTDDFVIHAWACGRPGVLDYVYIPPFLREKGLASALIGHICGDRFVYTRPWPYRKEPKGGTYNPYRINEGSL